MKKLITILSLIILLTSTKCFTQEKYQLECKEYLLKASMDSLLAQIGTKEKTGNNDGATLKYQKPFGLKFQSYCAMGQDWCFLVCAKQKSDIPYKFSANAQAHFNYAKKYGVKVPYRPEIHDLVIWKTGPVKGHIERITKVVGAGFVSTVGFNTSNGKSGSQYNGNGVYPRLRHIFNPVGLMLIKGLVGFKPICCSQQNNKVKK
jgi:hypothetical protein